MNLASIVSAIFFAIAIVGCNNQPPTSDTALAADSTQVEATTTNAPSMLGVCWTAGDTINEDPIISIWDKGVNYISQTPFGYQPDYNKPYIRTGFEDQSFWGESDRGLIHTANLGKAKGIKTMMKPHLWMNFDAGKWRSDLAMESEEDWQQWFKNYSVFILHFAKVAEEGQMESLCIGTELHETVKQRPNDWRALIKEIRKVYSGELTYAANFYHEFEDVTFWDDLDFIGVQGYFPLTSAENPTVEQLLAGWEEHASALEAVARKYRKQVVFTEIGYKSHKEAAIRPWEWPQGQKASYDDTSTVTQARCYEAMFQTFAEKAWFDGFFIWKWHPESFATPADKEAKRKKRIAHWKRESPQIGFTPQGKAAEFVMAKWFKKWRL